MDPRIDPASLVGSEKTAAQFTALIKVALGTSDSPLIITLKGENKGVLIVEASGFRHSVTALTRPKGTEIFQFQVTDRSITFSEIKAGFLDSIPGQSAAEKSAALLVKVAATVRDSAWHPAIDAKEAYAQLTRMLKGSEGAIGRRIMLGDIAVTSIRKKVDGSISISTPFGPRSDEIGETTYTVTPSEVKLDGSPGLSSEMALKKLNEELAGWSRGYYSGSQKF